MPKKTAEINSSEAPALPAELQDIEVGFSAKGVTNTALNTIRFFGLLPMLRASVLGGKDDSYFIQGLAKTRSGKYLHEASLTIIDADKAPNGGPPPAPELVHAKLVELNLNHCIFT